MRYRDLLAVCGAVALLAMSGSPSVVGERVTALANGKKAAPAKSVRPKAGSARHRARRATRVRGFVLRGGYYSYIDADVINVYGGSRAKYGSTNTYRDFLVDRQTTAGPFDNDFFFDSGIGPRWNDSPYPR
jgi:hypothetical protein